MRGLLVAGAVFLAVIVLVMVTGLFLSRTHRVTSRLALPVPPESVWSVVRDIGQLPSWWTDVKGVERVEQGDGKERWRETMGGDMRLVLRIEDAEPPRRMRSIIEDTGEPFGGEWVYLVASAPGGSTIEITEDGWVSNPVFRVVSRVIGHHRTIDSYLAALARRFGAPARIEHVAGQ